MIKTGTAGYCKQEFQGKLKGDDTQRGDHVTAVTTLDGVKVIALE